MNRLFLLFVAAGAGATGFTMAHRSMARDQANTAARVEECQASEKRVAEAQARNTGLRNEVLEKKQQLRETLPHANISPELLLLLTGDPA